MSARFFFFNVFPLFAYAVFIAIFSIMPMPPIIPEIWNIDKVQHMVAYGIMAILFLRLFIERRLFEKRRATALAFIAATAFGGFIEIVQSFTPTRFGDIFDAMANAIGAFAGAYLYSAVFIRKRMSIE